MHLAATARAAFAATLPTLWLSSTPAQAQVGPFADAQLPNAARVSVGVRIPLGGAREEKSNAPRLELSLAPEWSQTRDGFGPALQPPSIGPLVPPSQPVLSFRLDRSRRVDLMGQRIAGGRFGFDDGESDADEDKGASTGTKALRLAAIAGGVMVLGLGGLYIAYATSDDDE